MEGVRAPARRWFFAEWLLASAVIGMVGLAVMVESVPFETGIIRSGDASDTAGWSAAWAVILGGLLCGATLGAGQWWLLRRHVVRPKGWALVSTLGFALAVTVVWALGGASYGDAYGHHALPHSVDGAGLPGGVLLGAMFGAAQWFVLRRHVARAGWWIPANSLAFAASWTLAASTTVDGPPAHFVGGAIFGIVLGLVTGGVLWWLFWRVPGVAAQRSRWPGPPAGGSADGSP